MSDRTTFWAGAPEKAAAAGVSPPVAALSRPVMVKMGDVTRCSAALYEKRESGERGREGEECEES